MMYDVIDVTQYPEDGSIIAWTYENRMLTDTINIMSDGSLFVQGRLIGSAAALYRALDTYFTKTHAMNEVIQALKDKIKNQDEDNDFATAFKLLLQMTNKEAK